jgi:hypothetical protein
MAQVKDITVINVDGKTYAVDTTSEAVQELVELYNKFNRRAADIQDDLTMAVAAREQIAQQINFQLRREEQEAADKAAAEMPPATEDE